MQVSVARPQTYKDEQCIPWLGDHVVQWSLACAVARDYGSPQEKGLTCLDMWVGARFGNSFLEMDFQKVSRNCAGTPVKLF